MKERYSSLSGILSQGTPTPRDRDALPDAEPDAKVKPATAPATAKRPRPKQVPRVSESSDGGRVRLAFRLAPELKNAVAERAVRDKIAQADVIRDALEAAIRNDALEAKPKGPTDDSDRLFSRPRRRSATASVPFDLGVTLGERQAIDDLVEKSAAVDRTDLITRALRVYLRDPE